MLPVFYYEKYMQQRKWELEREAEKQRLVGSIRPEGRAHFMSRLGSWFMGLGLQLQPGKQIQSQPRAITGNL